MLREEQRLQQFTSILLKLWRPRRPLETCQAGRNQWQIQCSLRGLLPSRTGRWLPQRTHQVKANGGSCYFRASLRTKSTRRDDSTLVSQSQRVKLPLPTGQYHTDPGGKCQRRDAKGATVEVAVVRLAKVARCWDRLSQAGVCPDLKQSVKGLGKSLLIILFKQIYTSQRHYRNIIKICKTFYLKNALINSFKLIPLKNKLIILINKIKK